MTDRIISEEEHQDEIDRVFEALGSPVMSLTELAEERGWDEDDLEAALGAARAMGSASEVTRATLARVVEVEDSEAVSLLPAWAQTDAVAEAVAGARAEAASCALGIGEAGGADMDAIQAALEWGIVP